MLRIVFILSLTLAEKSRLFPNEEEWLCNGDAVIYEPFGGPVAGPLHREKGILYADIQPSQAAIARRSLDVAGHYSRPDIFKLEVDRRELPPVDFVE